MKRSRERVAIEFPAKEFLLGSMMHSGICIIDIVLLINQVNICYTKYEFVILKVCP